MADNATKRPIVFICWAGAASEKAAIAIKKWLEDVFPAVDVFFSTESIRKGTRWEAAIALHLQRAVFGILCLTPVSQKSAWLLYEAGALTGQLADERVSPLLIGIQQTEVLPPIKSVQSTGPTAEEVTRLARAINQALPDPSPEDRLERNLPLYWKQLEPKLMEAIAAAEKESEVSGISAKRSPEDMFAELVEGQRSLQEEIRSLITAQNAGGVRTGFGAIPPRVRGLRTPPMATVLDDLSRAPDLAEFQASSLKTLHEIATSADKAKDSDDTK